ncbi:fumarylacetoacetate hydrolase family protein [Alteribacillus sp. HJP-4]|uniref:fumarylacetoacetate hydrolase family protein n=1 Tax=Alteribacillus sp. HJP-4 TaxID=2775394 RepID=UPI0035CD2D28
MKFAKFIVNDELCTGVVSESKIDEIVGDIFGEWEYNGRSFAESQVKWAAPVEPSKVIGIGANYVGDTSELPDKLPEIPVFFFKPASSVIGTGQQVVLPQGTDTIKFESELAVVIGREAKNVSEDEALDYVFGYTAGNDVTAPQYFREDGHWTIGKSFDTFTPLGPVIETELDPLEVAVKAEVDGVEKQNSKTELMIVPTKKMISYLSSIMTLSPGDVILTGSPLGAEMVGNGTVVDCKIDGIGTLRNTIVKAAKTADTR